MPLTIGDIQFVLDRLLDSEPNSFQGLAGQLFGALAKGAPHNSVLRRYESDRRKWADWPNAKVKSIPVDWTMPVDIEEATSLAYDLYKSCSETAAKASGLPFTLFGDPRAAANIREFNRAFGEYLKRAVSNIVAAERAYQINADVDRAMTPQVVRSGSDAQQQEGGTVETVAILADVRRLAQYLRTSVTKNDEAARFCTTILGPLEDILAGTGSGSTALTPNLLGTTTLIISDFYGLWSEPEKRPDLIRETWRTMQQLMENVRTARALPAEQFAEAVRLVRDSVRNQEATLEPEGTRLMTIDKSTVFIVHGHDQAAEAKTAWVIQQLGLTPVILHEKPGKGRTVVEKLEAYSNVGFAIVLLTPDDVGASSETPDALQPRARQNVVLELGYFFGKLKRERVCTLYSEGVELPSDWDGVNYVLMDKHGQWRYSLIEELQAAGYDVDKNNLKG